MLLLILANRHLVGVVEQNVSSLKDRIVEQAGEYALLLLGLHLILGHALQPTQGRHAVEQPTALGVSAHVALHKQRGLLRIDPGGDQQRGQFAGLAAQGRRLLRHRDRVQVNNADKVGLFALPGDPLLDRAQVVTDMQHPRGLDA